MKRALISVYNKEGLVEFVKGLILNGYEVISTGGTKQYLEEAGIKVIGISEITGFPEVMNGRVKTLHPKVHGALLCVRDNDDHMKELLENSIELIDMVVVNLYPFKETVEKENVTHEEIIENIDIGGPSMLRSAGKNYKYVTVCCDPHDYEKILNEVDEFGNTLLKTREYLAGKVFSNTAIYDSTISNYFSKKNNEQFPDMLTLAYEKVQDLRYGENPHQKGAFYRNITTGYSLSNGNQINGKELSYNNIQDGNASLEILREFKEPTVVVVKHMNPCGVGMGENLELAWKKAYEADPVSIFGGIVATNQIVDKNIALELEKLFLELIIAPAFEEEAKVILKKKKNLRIIELDMNLEIKNKQRIVSVMDGVLIQDMDLVEAKKNEFVCVTDQKPTEEDLEELLFAWKVVKHVKSNAIVLTKNNQTLGIGAGQMNRVGAVGIAIEQAKEKSLDSYMGSDAFFPLPDTVELAIKAGVKAIIQPGGSIKDKLSIERCNEAGIIMVFTNVRYFKH